MSRFIFVFGRTSELSWLEFSTLMPSAVRVNGHIARISAPETEAVELFRTLGGSVRICREVLSSDHPFTPDELLKYIAKPGQNRDFVLGTVDIQTDTINRIAAGIKTSAKNQDIPLRYVLPRNGTLASSDQLKQNVSEYILYSDGSAFYCGETVMHQDYQDWSQRDYDRPVSDPHVGMLPPKVARMAVHIALGGIPASKTVLDPFCGMGTILAESLLLGVGKANGLDISEKAVQGTTKNIEWLRQKYTIAGISDVKLGDATHASTYFDGSSVDAIVTEPFLGSPQIGLGKVSKEKIRNIVKGLDKLYIGSVKDWTKVLKPNGKIFMALPEFSFGNAAYHARKVIDTCENLGYTKVFGPIEYSRPQSFVKRLFYMLQKIS